MKEIDYTEYFEEIISLLKGNESQPGKKGRPVHSGHKGGAFMTEARQEFNARFKDADLTWSQVNKWITQLFKIAGQVGETSEDNLIWLHTILATSLENGFAQALKQ